MSSPILYKSVSIENKTHDVFKRRFDGKISATHLVGDALASPHIVDPTHFWSRFVVRRVLVRSTRPPHGASRSMDTAMVTHTRLVGILSLVQGASLPIVLNFDPKFKGSENIRFTYPP